MNIRTVITITVLLPLLTGCLTSGPTFEETAASLPAIAEGKGRVFFYRLSRWRGAAMQPTVAMNNEIVGRAVPNGFFYVDKDAGTYAIEASTGYKVQVPLQTGQQRFVELVVVAGGGIGNLYRLRPVLVHPRQGMKSIAKLHYDPPKVER